MQRRIVQKKFYLYGDENTKLLALARKRGLTQQEMLGQLVAKELEKQ